jgi:hypothetical protein
MKAGFKKSSVARRIGLCALLGLATTILVSWLASLCVSVWSMDDGLQVAARRLDASEGVGFLVVERTEAWASVFVLASIWRPDDLAGPSTVEQSQSQPADLVRDLAGGRVIPWAASLAPIPIDGQLGVEARGWPRPALWCRVHYEYDPANTWGSSKPELARFNGGLDIPWLRMVRGTDGVYRDAVLPMLPLWPGLALDTFVFASLWMTILLGSRLLRQFLRLRRNLCPRCAYNLQGQPSPGCPECGWNRPTASSPAPSHTSPTATPTPPAQT